MSQRPFISTQLNIFDDNRCVFSSGSIGGQPVMISQEQNRKICDSVTTAIASNQSRINPSYCAGPQLTASPNQSQFWPCSIQAQRQGVPGGVVFNFCQPNYCCPPSCLPSAYNPPPPPAPQIMETPYKTPQSICMDFGKYGMEAMIFQQKCRQQYQGFTYDKQVGTADQNAFHRTDTCSCGVQQVTLNAEQKDQLFHRIDERDSKAKLNVSACETSNEKKRCICFPKPDPNKFGSAKNLVIGERKEKSCKDYDIVEKATREADAEAYLCCDCLDKWKKENECKRPSCLKNRSGSNTEKQNESNDMSISLSGNALEITEDRQTRPNSQRLPTTEYSIQKNDIKDISYIAKNTCEKRLEWAIETIQERRRRLLQLQKDFELNMEGLKVYLDADEAFFNEFYESGKKETEKMKKQWNVAPDQVPDSKHVKYDTLSKNMDAMLTTSPSIMNETFTEVFNYPQKSNGIIEEEKKETQISPMDSNELETDHKKTRNAEQDPNESKPSAVTKPGVDSYESNNMESQPEDKKIESISNNEMEEQSDPPDLETKLKGDSTSNERDDRKPHQVKVENEKSANLQSLIIPSTSHQKSDEKETRLTNSDEITTENNSQPSIDFGRVSNAEGRSVTMKNNSEFRTIKNESVLEDQMEKVTKGENKSKSNPSDTEVPETSTSYTNKSLPSNGNEDSPALLSSPDYIKDNQNVLNKQDGGNHIGNQSTSDPQTSQEAESKEFEKYASREDEKIDEEKTIPAKNVQESTDKSTEVDDEDVTFKSCTCKSTNLLSNFTEMISNVCASTVGRAGNFLHYVITGRSPCAPTGRPFYENPRIITNSYGCHADCYDRRIKRTFSDLDRPMCSSRINTNRFCGRTCYDRDRNLWYSCCDGFSDRQNEVKITFKETSQRRSIRLENNCRRTRYHVVYE